MSPSPASGPAAVRVLAAGSNPEVAREAADLLRGGGLVALPTETVYGVAVRADDETAIDRLFRLKNRPPEKSLTLHLARAADASRHAAPLPVVARHLAARFWPGPLTLVVPARGSDALVGLRVPAHDFTREVLSLVEAPVAMPSANLSGDPPPVRAQTVVETLGSGLDLVVDGGTCRMGVSSTVVLARPGGWDLLREGAISREEIEAAACARVVFVCTGNTCRSPMAAALFRRALLAATGADSPRAAGFTVESVGLAAGDGAPASVGAAEAMRALGVDLSAHRSRRATGGRLRNAHRVFGMTRGHVQGAMAEGISPERVLLLDPGGREIADPFGGGAAVYEEAAAHIEAAVRARLDELLREESTPPDD